MGAKLGKAREPERKRPYGRCRHRWEDDIRISLREVGWKVVDWFHLAHDGNQLGGLLQTL
jgi:hypothetical protein